MSAFRKLLSIYVFSCFLVGFGVRMWDLIVSVPDLFTLFFEDSLYNQHLYYMHMVELKKTLSPFYAGWLFG